MAPFPLRMSADGDWLIIDAEVAALGNYPPVPWTKSCFFDPNPKLKQIMDKREESNGRRETCRCFSILRIPRPSSCVYDRDDARLAPPSPKLPSMGGERGGGEERRGGIRVAFAPAEFYSRQHVPIQRCV